MGTVFVFWLLLPGAAMGQLAVRQSAALQNASLTELRRHAKFHARPQIAAGESTGNLSAECWRKCVGDIKNDTIAGLDEGSSRVKAARDWRPWLYGFLCTSAINLASVFGYCLKPIMHKPVFGWVLMWLVGLAIGSMAGSGILHLIPQGFGITDGEAYITKAIVISVGLYCFYLIDRVLKIVTHKKTKCRPPKEREAYDDQICSVKNDAELVGQIDPTSIGDAMNPLKTQLLPRPDQSRGPAFILAFELHPISMPKFCGAAIRSHLPRRSSDDGGSSRCNGVMLIERDDEAHGHHHNSIISTVAPVAWMVVIGDALHNFVDGLAIGAAFTDDFPKALSVFLAVAFEEIPNELGDFAVLLNSGLSIKHAVGLNFAAACSNYIGLVIGLTLGEVSAIHDWIYCAAGGMFLYISLVVMVSELNHIGDRLATQTSKSIWIIFLIQNIGLWAGYLIMLFMAVYGDSISIPVISEK